MSLMDFMMNMMVNSMSKEKKEEMMINMMPLMMEGLNMNELMPKMMANMLKDASVDDVIDFIKDLLKQKGKVSDMLNKVREAEPMKQMMCKVYRSALGFEETVKQIVARAPQNGWQTPDVRDLQQLYHSEGLTDMTRMQIIYLCNPPGAYRILREDPNKCMSVLMPTGVSVYETSDGTTEIAAVHLNMMSTMFSGTIKEVLEDGGKKLEKTLEGIVQGNGTSPGHEELR